MGRAPAAAVSPQPKADSPAPRAVSPAPAAAPPASSKAVMLRGLVKGGVVHVLGGQLADGTYVKVIPE